MVLNKLVRIIYDEARKLLKWDSNKVAMYEIDSIIKGKL